MIVTVELTVRLNGKTIIGSKSEFDDEYFFGLHDAIEEVRTDIRSELIRQGWDAAVAKADEEKQ